MADAELFSLFGWALTTIARELADAAVATFPEGAALAAAGFESFPLVLGFDGIVAAGAFADVAAGILAAGDELSRGCDISRPRGGRGPPAA